MKLATCFGLIASAMLPVGGQSSPTKLARISFSGMEFVRLEDWARANNFQAKWSVPKQELKLTSSSSTLAFTIDSARMSLNGVHVWLSAPIALRNGSALIPWVDVTSAIQPLLSPAKTRNRPVKNIVLDPGHGGKDPGYHEGKQQEK